MKKPHPRPTLAHPAGRTTAVVLVTLLAFAYIAIGLLTAVLTLVVGGVVDGWQELRFRAIFPSGLLLAFTGLGLAIGRRWAGWLALVVLIVPVLNFVFPAPNFSDATWSTKPEGLLWVAAGAVLAVVAVWFLAMSGDRPGFGLLEAAMVAVLLATVVWIIPTPQFHPRFAVVREPAVAGIFVMAYNHPEGSLRFVLRDQPTVTITPGPEVGGGAISGDLILIGRDRDGDWLRVIRNSCNYWPSDTWRGIKSIPAGGGDRDGEAIVVPTPPNGSGFADPSLELSLRVRARAVPAQEQFRGSFCLDGAGQISDYIAPSIGPTGP